MAKIKLIVVTKTEEIVELDADCVNSDATDTDYWGAVNAYKQTLKENQYVDDWDIVSKTAAELAVEADREASNNERYALIDKIDSDLQLEHLTISLDLAEVKKIVNNELFADGETTFLTGVHSVTTTNPTWKQVARFAEESIHANEDYHHIFLEAVLPVKDRQGFYEFHFGS